MKTADPETLKTAEKTVIAEDNGMGDIKIHEGVIASLARNAALSVEGVARLAGSSLVDNIAEIVGSRRMQSRAVTISIGEKNDVSIELKIVLRFGCNIPEVATEVQKAVISEIESTSGMNVTSVDVLVQEIEAEQKEKSEQESETATQE